MIITTRALGTGLRCLAVGIALGSLFSPSPLWAFLALGCVGAVLVYGASTKKSQWTLLALMLSLALLGTLRGISIEPVRTLEADAFVGEKTQVVGVIARDPDRRANAVQYVIEVVYIGGKTLKTPVYVLVNLPRHPEYSLGDELTLSGPFAPPEDFETDPTRPPFPYVKYLAKDGIGYTMKFPSVVHTEVTDRFRITRTLSGWKRAILEKGNRIFPEPEGGLLAGMILGEKHALPKDVLDDMRVAGLVHIIVVSGYNMTVVAEAVAKVFRFLPLIARSGIGLLVVWVYAGMVSGGAPVIRAAIMTNFALLARMTGNSALALRLLYLSAAIMILENPRIVLDDASFHLSFLATFGLIVLSPKITAYLSQKPKIKEKQKKETTEKRGEKETPVPWWKELFSATLSAQLMVMPYILFFSGQLSPYALPANLLALPAVPVAMGFGALALLVGSLIPWLGSLLGALAAIPAWWVLCVGEWFARLPGSAVVFPIPLWGSLLLYTLGFAFFWFRRKSDGVDVLEE